MKFQNLALSFLVCCVRFVVVLGEYFSLLIVLKGGGRGGGVYQGVVGREWATNEED